ncbi:hypothetical protein DFJ74DRAFT_626862 [Hyaloraphidium curvatum]|nr:hypothetical protein DFJ74DRAFT_626862 [Hyaloraphidium curvatum]
MAPPPKDPVFEGISKISNKKVRESFAAKAKAANAPAGMGTPANRTALNAVHNIAPDLLPLLEIMTAVFYHGSLEDVERSRCIVTALIVQGAAPEELEVHAHTALNVGMTPRELVALALSTVGYVGFPRAINGLKVVQKVLESRGQEDEAREGWTGFLGKQEGEEKLDPIVALMKRGQAKISELRERGEPFKAGVGHASLPDVSAAGKDLWGLLHVFFGPHYNIPGITDAQRSMTVVAALMTLGTNPHELEVHAHTALNNGITPEKLVGMAYNLISYIGFPRSIEALRVFHKVLEKRGQLDETKASLPKL